MGRESLYLLGAAFCSVCILFLPSLVFALIVLSGHCGYECQESMARTQWLQVLWLLGCFSLGWVKSIQRSQKVVT